jgi:hypothetical protein
MTGLLNCFCVQPTGPQPEAAAIKELNLTAEQQKRLVIEEGP